MFLCAILFTPIISFMFWNIRGMEKFLQKRLDDRFWRSLFLNFQYFRNDPDYKRSLQEFILYHLRKLILLSYALFSHLLLSKASEIIRLLCTYICSKTFDCLVLTTYKMYKMFCLFLSFAFVSISCCISLFVLTISHL